MDIKAKFLELEFQKDLRLSGLWHTIYHEGIRGHHILFDSKTVKDAEESTKLESNDDSLSSAVLHVMSQPTLEGIKKSMHHYDHSIKKDLYRLYKRALFQWQGRRIANLN